MVFINKDSKELLYMQIYQQIKKEIMDSTRKEGEVLTGSRSMAKMLGVSRNTVDNAYSQLLLEGYIAPKQGVGYIILKVPKMSNSCRKQFVDKVPTLQILDGNTKGNRQQIVYDLTNSSHTSDLFPKRLWRRYTLECLDILEKESRLSIHIDKMGELYLRHNLRTYLERIRGVRCVEEQIVITSGIQQSLDFICKLLPQERSVLLMEEPGYNKAAAVFTNAGLVIKTVSVDDNGLVVSKMPSMQTVCAVYTTPSHQFPTGAILPIGRRYELLRWAKVNDAYIIEDDFDSEQRYYAKPIPSLQSIDTDDRVIYLGTFSKALSPSLRMGYMILPPKLMKLYLTKFQNYNSTAPLLNQYIIAKLIESGQYDRHIRRVNHIFRKRLECFQTEFADISKKLEIFSNGTGQYFLLKFQEDVTQEVLIEEAQRYGVQVYSTMQFWQDKADCPPNTLFLGFSKIDIKDISDCVMRLKMAWSKWL